MKNKVCMLVIFLFIYGVKAEYEYSPQFNITVNVVGLPSLSIISPLNDIYFNNSVRLKTITSGDNLWYNLNDGINISFTNETILYVLNGNYVLKVFANNSYGMVNKSVNFNVNSSVFRIIYDEYKGMNRGNSTDFNYYSYNEIQNLGDIILENVNHGKIEFFENINLTDDFNFNDGILDLDSNTEIALDRIFVDVGKLPNFNKNSRLIFYNLNFNNPRVLLNGAECPLNVCALISYIGGTLIFNASFLGNFVVDETPAGNPGENGGNEGGGGGGGNSGGGGVSPAESNNNIINKIISNGDFSIDKNKMIITLKQGEAKREKFSIENVGENDVELSVNNIGLNEFLRAGDRKFILKKGEKTSFLLDFLALENKKADVYTGKIIVLSGNIKKEILVSVEVENRAPLLDVKMEILKEYLSVGKGGEVIAKFYIVNLDRFGEIDAEIEYGIKDMNNNIIYKENEIINFIEKIEFERKFVLPDDINAGDYVLFANVLYEDKTANSSAFFKVARYFYLALLIFILVGILLFFVYLMYKNYKSKKIAEMIMKKVGRENL